MLSVTAKTLTDDKFMVQVCADKKGLASKSYGTELGNIAPFVGSGDSFGNSKILAAWEQAEDTKCSHK